MTSKPASFFPAVLALVLILSVAGHPAQNRSSHGPNAKAPLKLLGVIAIPGNPLPP